MASHDGLRLYLGKYAPDEVLKHIFSYGFHLWLARPVEVVANFQLDYGMHNAFSTRRAVLREQLSDEAREMVQYESYWDSIFDEPYVEFFPMHLARPMVWSEVTLWIRYDYDCDEQWLVPNLPHYYANGPAPVEDDTYDSFDEDMDDFMALTFGGRQ
jgi:hypothetical protein